MLKKTLFSSLLLVSSLSIAASASAQVYIGGTSGQSTWSSECNMGVVQCDKSSTAYKIFAAYEVDQNFAIEASLFSLGKLTVNAKTATGQTYATADATGFELAGVLKQNITEDFATFAKLGLASVTVGTNKNAAFLFFMADETTSTQPVAGLGLRYKVSRDFALRGEFEIRRTKLGNEKNTIHNISVGAQYSF
jgi:OOP family OmpA-OmpF porin